VAQINSDGATFLLLYIGYQPLPVDVTRISLDEVNCWQNGWWTSSTTVWYWIITIDKMQETNSDAVIHRRRALLVAGMKCILTLPRTFGCTEYFCCWNNPALCHARIQSNMTQWLAYIVIIGNVHDVDMKALSDFDAVVNSSGRPT